MKWKVNLYDLLLIMNPSDIKERLAKLKAGVRTGGKGTPRRGQPMVVSTAVSNRAAQEKLFKSHPTHQLENIEQMNVFCENGTVFHFSEPKGTTTFPIMLFLTSMLNGCMVFSGC
jgi:hypothetical protein